MGGPAASCFWSWSVWVSHKAFFRLGEELASASTGIIIAGYAARFWRVEMSVRSFGEASIAKKGPSNFPSDIAFKAISGSGAAIVQDAVREKATVTVSPRLAYICHVYCLSTIGAIG